jgi:8-oxo-(d)GTP phosphatase
VSGNNSRTIRAAGGVLWRQHDGRLDVAVIHRARYDDWTLPKGKVENDERTLLAAVREIAEETGSQVTVGRRLLTTEYHVGGVPKVVSYWSMRHESGWHVASDEVDALRWVTPEEAVDLLSYDADRLVLADFLARPVATAMLLLMRHAKAGKRSDYRGNDNLRPLDKIGRRQARDTVPFVGVFGPAQVLSANRVRCEQTVTPLADSIGQQLIIRPEFSDEAYGADPDRAWKSLQGLLDDGGVTALCSQGGAIPALLGELGIPKSRLTARKGSLWVLSFHGRDLIGSDYYPRPQV